MQERITILISDETTDPDDVVGFIKNFLSNHHPSIKTFLNNFWYHKKATVGEMAIDRESIRFVDQVHGTFTVRYSISFYFACDQVTVDKKETMELTFEIAPDFTSVSIEGELEPERSDEL